MPLAKDVAAELRKLADCLDIEPDAEMPSPIVGIIHHKKESFLSVARIMPRPFKKGIDYPDTNFPDLCLTYKNDNIHIYNKIPQKLTCELVEPAKPAVYRCDPILSAEEDAELETA